VVKGGGWGDGVEGDILGEFHGRRGIPGVSQ
jgi:hypothetical protein